MTTTKRGTAITGDMFVANHPTLDLSGPFSSHVDVLHDGVTHQVLSLASASGLSYANTTGEFTVGSLRGHVVESIDQVETQAVVRHQAIVASEHGALSVHGYDGAHRLVALLDALRPTPTPLGMAVDPDGIVDYVRDPRVVLTTPVGLIEVTPLTVATNRELPAWRGTSTPGGDLYGGSLADESPYLTLVGPTTRAVLMPGVDTDIDRAVEAMAELTLTWSTA